jgi:hypothetical protein
VEGEGSGTTQADGTDKPPEGNDDSSGSGVEEEAVSRADFKKVQSEAKSLRARLRETEERLSSFENQGKSETEKMQTEIQKREERIETLTAANRSLHVQALAPEFGIADPLAAARLMDWDLVDDVTDPQQVKAALKDVAKRHPLIVRDATSGGADGGAGTRTGKPPRSTDMNAEIRRMAGRA